MTKLSDLLTKSELIKLHLKSLNLNFQRLTDADLKTSIQLNSLKNSLQIIIQAINSK
jgi:hypothetical protein